MITYDQLIKNLTEGIYDPGIFKAFFCAGGPGSGKSYVAKKIGATAMGLKIVSSDTILEYFAKKDNFSLDMNDPEVYKIVLVHREKAKELTSKKMDLFIQGRLGLVIDGTGKDFNKIKRMADLLKNIGYDTHMIFVNTSLETAMERNMKRDRSLPDKVVKEFWLQVQSNIGKFQNYFGSSNFIVVDNNNANEDVFVKVMKQIKKLIDKPVENYKAKQWIQKELEYKNTLK